MIEKRKKRLKHPLSITMDTQTRKDLEQQVYDFFKIMKDMGAPVDMSFSFEDVSDEYLIEVYCRCLKLAMEAYCMRNIK